MYWQYKLKVVLCLDTVKRCHDLPPNGVPHTEYERYARYKTQGGAEEGQLGKGKVKKNGKKLIKILKLMNYFKPYHTIILVIHKEIALNNVLKKKYLC